jgi:hypothetical protein
MRAHLHESLELVVDNPHILNWIEKRDAVRKPSVNLQYAPPQSVAILKGAKVFGQKHTYMAYGFDGGEEYRDHKGNPFLTRSAWLNTVGCGVNLPIRREF